MWRLLLLMVFSLLSSAVFAADTTVPSIFTPAEEDKSLAYLGAIFGNQLVPGGTDMHLLSYIFEIFNQVALSVGLIIIIYTLIVGTLHTAGQGKPLGEKWNGLWIPVRMVVGMSLLVPKAGTGYCMAQYIVMWLVIQGIGAADTVWNKALDYFIEGGAIYSETLGKAQSYMNKGNLENTYTLEQYLLINAACVDAHNQSEEAALFGQYKIYSTDDNLYVNFGNPKAWEQANSSSNPGQECGAVSMPAIDPAHPEYNLILQTYNNAFYSLSVGLSDIGKFLAGESGADDTLWPGYFSIVQVNAVTFIEYLKGASSILFPDENKNDSSGERKRLEELKKYGWVLAGNYYMTLSSFQDKLEGISIIVPDKNILDPGMDASERYARAITNAKEFWGDPSNTPDLSDERRANSFYAWPDENKYETIPGYEDIYSDDALNNKNYGVNKKDLENIKSNLRELGGLSNLFTSSGASGHGSAKIPTRSPIYYMDQITGVNGEYKDPILRAAKFGKKLTEIAVGMVLVYIPAVLLLIIGFWKGWTPCAAANDITIPLVIVLFSAPLVFAIATFLYVQGVMLGVLLPLIPFIIFLVGVLGWFLSVIESVVAAPLVAIGLIFPETQQEVWGRAEPAYMMILNLFLRPSLMIIGFLAGMILTWVAIELLNAAFYLFVVDAAHIENILFGYIVITLVYVGVLLSVVSKAFGLINDLPNKTLLWIGDRTQAQEGAAEMIGAAKAGSERGGQSAGGGITTAGNLVEKAATSAQGMKPKATGNKITAQPTIPGAVP